MSKISTRSLTPYLFLALVLFVLNACQYQPAKPTSVGPIPSNPIPAANLPAEGPIPSVTPPEAFLLEPTEPVDLERRPGPGITASAVTADGSFWYGYDTFDGLGGSPPGRPNQGLYRLVADQVSHYQLPGAIRVLAVAPDDTLYIGAGCGVMHFQAGRMETLLNVDCSESSRRPSLLPMDIAFDHDGRVWVGGAHNLASYDGLSWQEYGLPALRVVVAPDDTIWTVGWDGRNGSDCCITHLTAKGPVSYTWPAGAQVPPEVLNKLFGPQIR